ncbi:hypothetical protein LAUMK35_05392 [Mycobacterium pseudokansasii]|nr:hypothetical protein LAUMK35_05392 [Mycobacterium pseudokansasii]VBA34746.1 hypothetical protein LAUMK21_05351 [Mycobacterium pseudokansasii]
MAADTSSSAAANRLVVGAAAAALAAPIVEPMVARSDAAVATMSGAAMTNDIRDPSGRDGPGRRATSDVKASYAVPRLRHGVLIGLLGHSGVPLPRA